jgi:hypothetical protein
MLSVVAPRKKVRNPGSLAHRAEIIGSVMLVRRHSSKTLDSYHPH